MAGGLYTPTPQTGEELDWLSRIIQRGQQQAIQGAQIAQSAAQMRAHQQQFWAEQRRLADQQAFQERKFLFDIEKTRLDDARADLIEERNWKNMEADNARQEKAQEWTQSPDNPVNQWHRAQAAGTEAKNEFEYGVPPSPAVPRATPVVPFRAAPESTEPRADLNPNGTPKDDIQLPFAADGSGPDNSNIDTNLLPSADRGAGDKNGLYANSLYGTPRTAPTNPAAPRVVDIGGGQKAAYFPRLTPAGNDRGGTYRLITPPRGQKEVTQEQIDALERKGYHLSNVNIGGYKFMSDASEIAELQKDIDKLEDNLSTAISKRALSPLPPESFNGKISADQAEAHAQRVKEVGERNAVVNKQVDAIQKQLDRKRTQLAIRTTRLNIPHMPQGNTEFDQDVFPGIIQATRTGDESILKELRPKVEKLAADGDEAAKATLDWMNTVTPVTPSKPAGTTPGPSPFAAGLQRLKNGR